MRGFDLDQASANHGTGAGSVEPVFSVSVCLAGRVVPWHTFNLVGFGPVNFQACHSKHQGATVRPGRSASSAAISTFQAKSSDLPGNAITDPHQRYEMKNPTFAAELHKKLGAPSRETLESLRLLKAFLRLAPRQRFEVIELIERLAIDPAAASDGPLDFLLIRSGGRPAAASVPLPDPRQTPQRRHCGNVVTLDRYWRMAT